MEDYLERIFDLIEEKGYARVSDIAEALDVHPSTVTRMVQRLDEHQFIEYERYRGLVLTAKGEKLGRAIRDRHRALESFLRLLGVEDEDVVQKDTEGMEHHLSPSTLHALTELVVFLESRPDVMEDYRQFKVDRQANGEAPSGDAASDASNADGSSGAAVSADPHAGA